MKPDRERRKKQLINEIGIPLLEQAVADIGEYEHSLPHLVEGKLFAILEKLDETLDPSVLLPLLNVPDEVRPHFEDALKKRLMLCHRPGRPPIPSYLPMPETEATTQLAATFVRYLKAHGAPEDAAIELMALVYELKPNKLFDVVSGKSSSVRNLKARRARAREPVE
jgi:hypothetical protein